MMKVEALPSSSSMALMLLFFSISLVSSLPIAASSSSFPSSSFCPKQSLPFLSFPLSQCPFSFSPNPPRQVDGNLLDKALGSIECNRHISVLFYASWCPFSRNMSRMFESLSSIYPQVEHLVIEQSSAMPSVFSRYGIHSLPSILIANQTTRLQYHGPKDLQSILQFYERITGLEADYHHDDQLSSYETGTNSELQMLHNFSMDEIIKKEPYLALSLTFVSLRILFFIVPAVLSQLKAFWVNCIPNFKLEIFGETSQIIGRVIQTVDVKGVWTKLSGCKIRNFQESTRNAKIWASSLTSVSLGESSSRAR